MKKKDAFVGKIKIKIKIKHRIAHSRYPKVLPRKPLPHLIERKRATSKAPRMKKT